MMHRTLALVAALTWSLYGALGAASAEERMALIIGNSTYQSVSALPNPANDAKAIAELLKSANFDVVSTSDLTQADMRRTISDFAAKVAARGKDTVALVYYAGHGVQVDGENYLIPVDARIRREADVPLQSLRLADLMNALASVPSRTRIVMLDACRNNPFSEINKTSGRGLAIVDAPSGSIISYATAPGMEAEDGTGTNSPYTTALLTVAKEPGVPIEQAFKRVRLLVNQTTDGRQIPWESSSLTGDFSFFPDATAAAQPEASAAIATPRPTPVSAVPGQASTGVQVATRSVESWTRELRAKPAQEAYDIVIREDTPEAYQAFIALHSTPPFGQRVRGYLERRRQMIAWYSAVTVNTPVSYQTFLATYPNSDLTVSAQALMTRAATRSLASLAPAMCPCAAPALAPVERRAVAPQRGKRAAARETAPPKQRAQRPRRVVVEADDEPPPVVRAVPVGIPIGIGIGGGRIPIGGGSRYPGRYPGGGMSTPSYPSQPPVTRGRGY